MKAITRTVHKGGNDFENGSLVVARTLRASNGNQNGLQATDNLVTHALTRRWDSGEDGTGRGTPLVAEPRPGDEAKADRNAGPLGFRCDCGLLYLGELSTPCPACGGFGGTATYPPGRGGCAGGWADFMADLRPGQGVVGALGNDKRGGGWRCGPDEAAAGQVVVAGFKRGQGDAARSDGWQEQISPTLTGVESGTQNPPGVQVNMVVRRLTPVECCRLQGFPDHHLDLDPPLSDSARYRLLGNAVCVAVSRWLGRRIALALKETTPGA